MPIEIRNFRKMEKNGLAGFLEIELTATGLCLRDVTLHQRNGRTWIGMPSRSYKDRDGNERWQKVAFFENKERFAKFQKAILASLDEYLKKQVTQPQKTKARTYEDIPF